MAFVPDAQTYEAIKDSILAYLKLIDDTRADTLAALAVRSGLVRLAAYPLKGNLATDDISLSTSFHTFSVPADFNMAFSLHFLDTSDNRDGRIVYKREENFDQIVHRDEGVVGVPTLYTVRGGETVAEMDKTPGSITVHPKVRLRYFRRYNNLTTSTDSFSFAPEFEEFLIWHGRKELAAIYDSAKYPLAQAEADRSRLDLVRRDTIRDEQDWV